MKRPIVIALIGYIIGIIWELYLNKISIALIILICFLIIIFSKNSNIKKILILIIAFIFISKINIHIQEKKYNNLYNNLEKGEFIGTIVECKKETAYKIQYKIKIESVNNDIKYKNTYLLLYIDKNFSDIKYADKIMFSGTYSKANKAKNYKAFDYSEYLKTQKIYGILNAEKSTIKIIKHNNSSKFNIFINKIKGKINSNLDFIIKNENKELLKGILLGNTEEIDEELKENFRTSNMYHLLAVSGTHVSFVVLGIVFILGKININKKISKVLCSIILIFYMVLIGFTPSVTRACIMAIISSLAFNFYKKSDVMNNIAISLFIILINNPYSIKSLSLLLSYFGTIGIIYFYNIVYEKLKFIQLEKVRKMLSVSISAQITIMPIIIFNFNTFSLTFFISSLLYSFIIGAILILGYILIIISFINLFIASKIAIIVNSLLKILIYISNFSSKIPFSKIYLPTPSFLSIVIYYIVIFLASYILKNKKYNYNILLKICIIVFIISTILNYFYGINIGKLKIHFIDVGQGDACLIIGENNTKILIDGGGSSSYDVGKNVLLPYLLDRQITCLDYIIISHFDDDHVGGLLTILEELKVKNVIIGKQPEDSENFEKLKKIIKKKKIKIIVVGADDPVCPQTQENKEELRINNVGVDVLGDPKRIYIEEKLYFDLIWPDTQNKISENPLNNNSLVIKLNYKNFSMLFTGDIEELAEKQIIQKYKENPEIIKSTVLKVAHHGSKTSSTQDIINIIKPQIALIGVGENNKFGHPNKEIIKRLKDIGAKIYRTDQDGEITITVNKNGTIKVKKHINL